MKYFLSLFLFLFILKPSLSAQENALPELKILSWNIYMLPAVTALSKEVGKTHKMARTNGIIEFFKEGEYDILVLQESFHHFSRWKMKRKLKKEYPFQYGPANQGIFGGFTNSGITILSKIPLTNKSEIKYKFRSGIDKTARKGVLFLEGNWHGQAFQICGTHLQAGGKPYIKETQLLQIENEVLRRYQKKNVPQIICGDMNIGRNNPLFKKMIRYFDTKDYQLQDSSKVGQWGEIDYIFYRKNGRAAKSIHRRMLKPQRTWKKDTTKKWLSDHNAVEAIIQF